MESISVEDPQFLFNRELSWLEFNRRVLEEAMDETNPLLERLRFLTIFSTNLDEFFMIRVSGLKEQVSEGVNKRSFDGLTAADQLIGICEKVRPMIAAQMQCLTEDILPKLSENGVLVLKHQQLSDEEKSRVNEYFLRNVFPVLTPQAVDPSHPFPFVSNLSLNLGIFVKPSKVAHTGILKNLFSERRFIRIKLPPNISRLIPVDESGNKFVRLGDLISENINVLLPNSEVEHCYAFRVTRDADIEIREDEAGDLLSTIQRQLYQQRRFSFPVRLEVDANMPQEMIDYLSNEIGLEDRDIYRIHGPLNIPDLVPLCSLDAPNLKYKPFEVAVPKKFKKSSNLFESIRKKDIFLHHPYTSFSAVTDFIDAAANDENVLAIKICLYRTGQNSPIVESLINASRNGKQVAALVELKARFDEANNIEWAKRLESEGVHVIYGMRGMKTHSKIALVVRAEEDGLRRYVHLATGNYNPMTARVYTDLGLLTADEELGADASDLFNFLTGYALKANFRKLLVAPVHMRDGLKALIDRETALAQEGNPGEIVIKVNGITDEEMVWSLYRASQAGVKINLIVRGICVLRPGIPGLSENITVRSIVGRFLEHSRIFYFSNGGNEEIYIGSADMMHRNLDRRVEAIVPIKDKKFSKYLRKQVLTAYTHDNVNAQILHSDGSYERLRPSADHEAFDSQMYFVGQEL